MQAITTRYIGATNTKPSRLVATTASGLRHAMSYNSACDAADNKGGDEAAHRIVAEALRDKLHWKGKLIAGGLKDGYAFVFVDK